VNIKINCKLCFKETCNGDCQQEFVLVGKAAQEEWNKKKSCSAEESLMPDGYCQYDAVRDSDYCNYHLVEHLESYKKDWQSIAGKANLTTITERLKQAEDLIEDIILMNNHAPFCRSKSSQYGMCSCMDTGHYNEAAILKRAEEHQKKWGF